MSAAPASPPARESLPGEGAGGAQSSPSQPSETGLGAVAPCRCCGVRLPPSLFEMARLRAERRAQAGRPRGDASGPPGPGT